MCEDVVRRGMLHEIFEASADASPDAVAVICGREETTYGEPEAQANRMARHLRRCGVRRGARVGLLLPRSAGAYAALLGILKAGAAYVPLDPECPAERIAGILADCAAAALVTTAALARGQDVFPRRIIRLDADQAVLAAESPVRLESCMEDANARDLC